MIIAEKLAQKLNNLKSKKEIKDFFIFYDEYRSLELNLEDNFVSNFSKPTTYIENSDGYFLIVWDENNISTGKINTDCINEFEDFMELSAQTKIPNNLQAFIPDKGIYPMIISYSKTLADMIDLPEYLLKITDVSNELDKMINANGSTIIKATEGTRYGFSSKELDEHYPYTEFFIEKKIGDEFYWKIEAADIFSLPKLEEIFSFFGDTYNLFKTSESVDKIDTKEIDIVLSPSIFQKLFQDQVLSNLNGQNIIENKSCFTKEDFKNKLKVYETLSFSYDPLINYKRGTYKFTSCGLKPQRSYFIKFGKLQMPLLNNLNYSYFDQKVPTVEITNISNIKFEGIKRISYEELIKINQRFLFGITTCNYYKKNSQNSSLFFDKILVIQKDQNLILKDIDININLMESIQKGELELVEFADGQLGCKLSKVKI